MKRESGVKVLAAAALLLLTFEAARAQSWTQIGSVPGSPTQVTGTYTPTNAQPYRRDWTKPVYDPVDQKLVLDWANPNCCESTFSNALFLYDPATNAWSLMWSNMTVTNGGGSSIASISRTNNVVSVATTNPVDLVPGSWVTIQGVADTSFNGEFSVASVSDSQHFSYNQTAANGTSSGGTVLGPADAANAPADRHTYHAIAWDSTRNALWTGFGSANVGGQSGTCNDCAISDLYELSFNSGTGHWGWSEQCGNEAPGCPPLNGSGAPGLQESAIAYNATSDVIALYGGIIWGTPTADTWLYYPATNTWTKVCGSGLSPCGPPQLNGHSMVAIGGGKILMFGGVNQSGVLQNGTWIFDTQSKTWTAAASSVAPPATKFPVMDYVAALGEVVLVGAESTGAQVWEFDPAAGQWAALNVPVGPTLNQSNPANNMGAYDPATGQFVLFIDGNGTQIWALSFSSSAPAAPVVLLSPLSLSFPSQTIGSASGAQQIVLTNVGTATLTVNSITVTGTNAADFAQTNTCPISPATLAAGASCQVNVTFTPSLAGTETASLNVSDNAAGSPQLVSLTGTGATSSRGGGGGGAGGGQSLSIPIGVQAGEWADSPKPSTNRTNVPVTFGVPLPDSDSIACSPTTGPLPYNSTTSQLELQNGSGTTLDAQFRCLGLWPSGNAEWVLVDAQLPTFTEGTLDSSLKLVQIASGGGNNPATSMAVQCTGSGTPVAGCPDANHIRVNTTAATFLIKEANYNLFDSVVVGSTTLVSSSDHGTDDGLVLMGPPDALTGRDAVSCTNGPPLAVDSTASACTNPYLSNLDAASTCTIEDNGPLRSVVMCQGDLKDSAAGVYMHWRTRTTFWLNHSDVKLDVALRNADSSTAQNAASAYKGFNSFEARLTMNLASGTRTVTFAGASSNTSETLTAGSGDSAYIYQGYSSQYEWTDWNNSTCTSEDDRCVVSPISRTGSGAPYTYGQSGFQIVKNGSTAATGTSSQYPAGWADEVDASSNGVEVGQYQFSANWPDALEFYSGGNEIRLALDADQTLFLPNPTNIQSYVQRWPTYQIRSFYLNFHVGALSSPADAFLDFQQPLLGRLPVSAYNAATNSSTGDYAMMLPLVDPVKDDTYWQGTGISLCPGTVAAGSCLLDVGQSGAYTAPAMYSYKYYDWVSGGTNQLDQAWSFIRNFLSRGCTPSGGACGGLALTGSQPGRYVRALNFYHLVDEGSIPRSDFGGWRTVCSSPSACQAVLSNSGYPDKFDSWNGGMRQWEDEDNGEDHLHTSGLVDYYFLTGDPWAYEMLQQGYKDIALNQNIAYNDPTIAGTNPGHNQFSEARALGHWLETHARESLFLCAIRDSNCDTSSTLTALKGAELAAAYGAAAPVIASGYPAGWTQNSSCDTLEFNTPCSAGTSPVRGFLSPGGQTDNCGSTGGTAPCDGTNHWEYKPFYDALTLEGLYFLNVAERSVRGVGWSTSITVAGDGNQINVPVTLGDHELSQLMYGIGNAVDKESFASPGVVYMTFPNWLNSTPPCAPGVPGNCSHACPSNTACGYDADQFDFFAIGNGSGTTVDLAGTSWQPDFESYIKLSQVTDEWEGAEENAVVNLVLNHNPSNPNSYALATGIAMLTDIAVSVSPSPCVGPATCTITWTSPSNLSPVNNEKYRLVSYSCSTGGADCPSTGKQIVSWLAFHSNCLTTSTSSECTNGTGNIANNVCSGGMNAVNGSGCWEAGKTPDTHANWFYSTAVTDPALQNATGSYSFTAAAGTTYTLNLKAWVGGATSGTGGGSTSPAVGLSPTSLSFSSQAEGTTSAPQQVTLTNTGTGALTISSIGTTGANAIDFAEASTCPISPATLAAGTNCAVTVTFKPSITGTETAALSISDNATGSPQSVTLAGTGATSSSSSTPPAPGTVGGAALTSNTQFSLEPEDLASALSSCVGCQFQSASDLLPGQQLEVTLESGASTPTAAAVILRLGTLNGTVTTVATNQFTIQLVKGTAGPSSLLVLAPPGITSYQGFSSSSGPAQVGQVVAVRGLLFKSGPQGGPTLLAERVVLGP
jgi:Kelch motif/HYDIN/CFA65/VesB-like, Ig-like domain